MTAIAAGDTVRWDGQDSRGFVLKAWDGWVKVRWDVPPAGIVAGWVVDHCAWMVVRVPS